MQTELLIEAVTDTEVVLKFADGQIMVWPKSHWSDKCQVGQTVNLMCELKPVEDQTSVSSIVILNKILKPS